MVEPLTERQRAVLTFLREALRRNGLPPTRSEIAEALGFRSPNAAEEHLRALARKGAIELRPGTSRGIRVLDPDGTDGLPVIGRVAAGQPVLAAAHVEDVLRIDAVVFRPRANYLLRVDGMSMRDAGILHGDLLAVHATTSAENGQIVVARLDDEVTVKRFRRRGHRVSLTAENPDFPPIEIDLRAQPLVIEGRAVGVLRTNPR